METMVCNACGREIAGSAKEEVLNVTKDWGYFSEKDLERHHFVLCESCYEKMIAGFVVPVTITEVTEV